MLRWQEEHAWVEWTPTRAKNWEWLKVAGDHAGEAGLWQVWQVVGKPAARWLGFVVAVYFALWQE